MKQIIIITLLAFLLNGCMLRHIFHGHGGGYSSGQNNHSRDTGRLNRDSSRDSRDYRR